MINDAGYSDDGGDNNSYNSGSGACGVNGGGGNDGVSM